MALGLSIVSSSDPLVACHGVVKLKLVDTVSTPGRRRGLCHSLRKLLKLMTALSMLKFSSCLQVQTTQSLVMINSLLSY